MADKRVAKKKPGRLARFWRETIGELRKVSWPTRREAINLTRIVILVIIVMMFFLGGFDYLFSRLMGIILG